MTENMKARSLQLSGQFVTLLGHLVTGENVMLTKREWAAQQTAKRKAEREAELANLVPNPNYRSRLTHSEIFAGVKKQPRFIPQDQLPD